MIDMYGQEVVVGDNIITWVKEGEGCVLKHVTLDKVNENTVEFTYGYTPSVRYYKPTTRRAKRKSNQIILLPPF